MFGKLINGESIYTKFLIRSKGLEYFQKITNKPYVHPQGEKNYVAK
jgi:hypothetical protein